MLGFSKGERKRKRTRKSGCVGNEVYKSAAWNVIFFPKINKKSKEKKKTGSFGISARRKMFTIEKEKKRKEIGACRAGHYHHH